LKKGTKIPPDIGVEIDGDNHVCLYPTGADISASDIESGLSSFTIDVLSGLQPAWNLYAIFQVRAKGFHWPEFFPSDSDLFPFRQWVTLIIIDGESEIAMNAAEHTQSYCCGSLAICEYLSKMLDLAGCYALDCSFEQLRINSCMLKALQFVLDFELVKKAR
jgi:hypothetical protein